LTAARATVNVDIFDTFDTFKQAHGVSDEVVRVFRIRIPSLRERREDIPLLVIVTLSSRGKKVWQQSETSVSDWATTRSSRSCCQRFRVEPAFQQFQLFHLHGIRLLLKTH
jgi:hypothetical protein